MKNTLAKSIALSCLLCGPLAAEPATYATPQDAVEAMMKALSENSKEAALVVFGPEADGMLSSGDPVEDNQNRNAVVAMYKIGFRMVPQEDSSVVLALGEDGWEFPIPISRVDGGWAFDIEAGEEELQVREVGLNELEVIDLMDAYVDVQAAFRLKDQDGDGVMEFARSIISSSEARRDGLFWGGEDSPLGELFARASASGYSDGDEDHDPIPYSGYYFRILTEQSDAAPGGAMNYLVNDKMVGGHALLAVPADFGESGIHSFMVSENGIILEAILGEDTLEVAAEMTAYDPNPDWEPFEE